MARPSRSPEVLARKQGAPAGRARRSAHERMAEQHPLASQAVKVRSPEHVVRRPRALDLGIDAGVTAPVVGKGEQHVRPIGLRADGGTADDESEPGDQDTSHGSARPPGRAELGIHRLSFLHSTDRKCRVCLVATQAHHVRAVPTVQPCGRPFSREKDGTKERGVRARSQTPKPSWSSVPFDPTRPRRNLRGVLRNEEPLREGARSQVRPACARETSPLDPEGRGML